MAGEKRGAIAEAMVIAALEQVGEDNLDSERLHWGKKPVNMSIDTDVLIGNIDAPELVVLVTSTGSEKESNRKFWRNVGEIVEMKTQLEVTPIAVSVVFTDRVKPNIKLLGAATFDRQIVVEDETWGHELLQVLDLFEKSAPADNQAKLDIVKNRAKKDKQLRGSLASLGRAILKEGESTDVGAELWEQLAARENPPTTPFEHTSFRRGIGKLILFPEVVTTGRRLLGKETQEAELALTTGIARRTLRGVEVTDPEILWVLNNFTLEQIASVIALQPRERMDVWVAALRGLPTLEQRASWLVNHWNDLSSAEFLLKSLEACHMDPGSLGPPPAGDHRVWVFHLIIDLLKSATGSQQGYGLSTLLEEMNQARKRKGHRAEVSRLAKQRGLDEVTWRDNRGISLGLADWVNGPSAQNFPVYPDDLARVACVLADRCGSISVQQASEAAEQLQTVVVATNLEARILTYRLLDPLGALLRISLEAVGVAWDERPYEPACFAQYALASGAVLDPRSGGTSGIVSNGHFLKWQSCTDSGRDHKKKELCGRIAALRFEWNEGFQARRGIDRFILVLDGTWRAGDIEALLMAGWDEVVPPTGVPALAAKISGGGI